VTKRRSRPPGSPDDDPAAVRAGPSGPHPEPPGPLQPFIPPSPLLLFLLLPGLPQLPALPGRGVPTRPQVRPGVGLGPADGGPDLQGAGSDRRPPQPLLPGRQRPLAGREPRGANHVPEEPGGGGPVHQQGVGGGRAGPVRHGAAGRRELRAVPERRGAGHRQRPRQDPEGGGPVGGRGRADRTRGSGLVARSER